MIVILRGNVLLELRGLRFGHRSKPGDELVADHLLGQLLRRAAVSTHPNRFACPGTTLWFRTISRPNVARSMSQDSISGSRNATQFSADTWKMSVSRNSSTTTRISS